MTVLIPDGEPFTGYALGVGRWRKVTNLHGRKRVPGRVLQLESTARDVRMATGDQKLLAIGGAGT